MFTPPRILCIESDISLARLLQERLEQAGYVVDVASSGEEGLAQYAAGPYDVVAVDRDLPVHDGLEVIGLLASQGPLPPTILLTAPGDERIVVEAMKLGASDYIVKDTNGGYLELLPCVIDQALQRRRLAEEKQQALEALERHNRNLALLNQVGQSLTATLDLQQAIDKLLQAVTEIVNAEGGSVWLWDEEKGRAGWLVCHAVLHHGLRHPMINLRLSPGEGIAGWVAQNDKSAIVSYAPIDRRFTPNIDARTGFHTTSLLAVPLRVRGSVIGVLEVVNKLDGVFTEDDRSLVETLAASAAIAIDNARMVEELRRQTVEQQVRTEELDAFAHTVAHDLQTPLGVIIGYVDVLLEEYGSLLKENEEALNYVRMIGRNGRKMANIIDELLVLSEVRKKEVHSEPLNMAMVVAEAQQRLVHLIEEKQAEIILPDMWPVSRGYAPWVEEVWVNYISNALKYGGQPPRIELGATVQDDGLVRYWVRDNGPGISPAEQERLFAPFTQLNSVRAGGHGLGLSIVRRIVEKLNGKVGVESESGKGSTFWFALPA